MDLASSPLFRLYAVCSAILVLKMFVVANLTAVVRARLKLTLNKEDATRPGMTVEPAEHADVARVLRAHRNDMENIPAFWAVGIVYALANASVLGGEICFILFTVARLAHSVMYLKGVQPWRTVMFGIGQLTTFAMIVLILIRVF